MFHQRWVTVGDTACSANGVLIYVAFFYYIFNKTLFATSKQIICPLRKTINITCQLLTSFLRGKTLQAMDERVGIIGEIISAMRVIKMYCWEKPFGKMVGEIRKKELGYIW